MLIILSLDRGVVAAQPTPIRVACRDHRLLVRRSQQRDPDDRLMEF
jgi:hypothetical protein